MEPSVLRINDLLTLQDVPRWTIVKVGRPQSVAEHSFNVAVIATELSLRLGRHLTAIDLQWALMHDVLESHTGDLPGNFKVNFDTIDVLKRAEATLCPYLPSMVPADGPRCIIKMADLIECVVYIWTWKVGVHAEEVWRYLFHKMRDYIPTLATAIGINVDFIDAIVTRLYSDITNQTDRLR